MPTELRNRDQYTLAVKCHWCGHIGVSLFEKTETGRQLLSLRDYQESPVKIFILSGVTGFCDGDGAIEFAGFGGFEDRKLAIWEKDSQSG